MRRDRKVVRRRWLARDFALLEAGAARHAAAQCNTELKIESVPNGAGSERSY
jgi:hypothetical protein